MDYNRENASSGTGVHPSLIYGDRITVRRLSDVNKIPTEFDYDEIARSKRHDFDSSNVRIHQLINVVYIISRVISAKNTTTRKRRFKSSGGSGGSVVIDDDIKKPRQ